MGWGIIATMSALVLSLLVASSKNTFDSVNSQYTDKAAQIIALNHVLIQYGADADSVRNDLKSIVAASIKRDWPDEPIASSVPAAPQHSNPMEGLYDELRKLKATTDEQHALLSDALQISRDLDMGRWLVIEQSKNSLPTALFVALVFWLTLLFCGLGLFSPHNKTVLVMLVMCSLSVSVAIFLINDMSHPLRGVIEVSRGPMVDAFDHLNQP